MRSITTMLAALALLLCITSAAVAAGNQADLFTITVPVIGGYTFDGAQHQQTRPVYGIRGGYNFTRNFGFEALFDYVQSTGTKQTVGDLHVYRYGGDLLWHFMPDNRLVPYLAAGYSAITTDYEVSAFLGGDAHYHITRGAADYGGGLKYFLNKDWALRGDVRHIIVPGGNTTLNYEYTLGLTYHFDWNKVSSYLRSVPESEEALEPEPEPEPVSAAPPAASPTAKSAVTPGAQQEHGAVSAPGILPEVGIQPGNEALLEPLAAAEPTPGRFKYCATLHIEFDVGSTQIRPEYHQDLALLGDFMKEYPTTTAVIEGHTDNIGNFQTNMRVSQQRAEAVVNYLVQNFGIERSRLSAKGYGSTRPVADNVTIEGQEKNRRIDAIIDCPLEVKKALPPPTALPAHLCVSLQLEFDSGKVNIKPQFHDEIARVGDFMNKYPTTSAVIEGHTDNIGSYEYNLKLSRQRAENVVNYLVKYFGIERSRLSAKGYSFSRRVAYNSTPEGRQKNRRINAIIDCVLKR